MIIHKTVQNQEFRCLRCGNRHFPGGTSGPVIICPVIGCNCVMEPDNMPLMLPDPDVGSFAAGAVDTQADGHVSPLIFARDEQGDMIVKAVNGSPAIVTVPEMVNGRTVMGVAPRAFRDHTQLRRVTLPDTVAIVGEEAFAGCTELESITFGKGLTLLDRGCLRGCVSLDSVTLPAKLREIGREAFADCELLEEVRLTGCVEVIRDSAFAMCARLSRFTFPERPRRIAPTAFSACYSLSDEVQSALFPEDAP